MPITTLPPLMFSAKKKLSPVQQVLHKNADQLLRLSKAPGVIVGTGKIDSDTFDVVAKGLAAKPSKAKQRPVRQLKMTPSQRFMVASITKPMTAVVIMKLVEEGKLGLDQKVNTILPAEQLKGLANAGDATVEQLLRHTAGVPEYYSAKADQSFRRKHRRSPKHAWQIEDLLRHARGQQPKQGVGEKYAYNNSHYLLLGLIAEQVGSAKLPELYRRFVFTPAGMKNSYFDDRNRAQQEPMQYYRKGIGRRKERLTDSELSHHCSPASGVISTATDLMRFFQAFFTGKLVKSETVPQMIQGTTLTPNYGLGFRFRAKRGAEVFHHGAMPGNQSFLKYDPETNQMFVFFVNQGSFDKTTGAPTSMLYHELAKAKKSAK